MDFATIFAVLAAVWWVLAVGALFGSILGSLVQPRVQRARGRSEATPPVSALLPIKLLTPPFMAAQDSIFRQDYPDYEVLVGAAEVTSPALDAMRQIADAHPERATRIVHSPTRDAASPKLNVLAAPLAAARHDAVLIKDAHMTLQPDRMRAMLENLLPGVGLVCAVPLAARPQSFAGRIEMMIINGNARFLLLASSVGVGFGVGKVMLFRRSDLARAGGIEAMGYTLAEDSAIAKGLAKIGLKTVFAHCMVDEEIGVRTFAEVYHRQARWCVLRREQEFRTYIFEPINSPLVASCAAVLAAPLIGLSGGLAFALTSGGWFAAEIAFTLVKGWEVSASAPLAFIGREIVSLAAWARAWWAQDVIWANGRFTVDAKTGSTSKTDAARASLCPSESGKEPVAYPRRSAR